MIFLDTSFLFAFFIHRDKYHQNAIALMKDIKNRKYGIAYISNLVFGEIMTLLRARGTKTEKIKEIGGTLINAEEFEFIHSSQYIFNRAWERFLKYEKISFTDCTIIETMILAGIDNIASFDKDFDFSNEIRRIE